MSFLDAPLTLLGIKPIRSFGNSTQIFSGYVTVTENTVDAIEITQQPVQQGAPIADHAFKKPISLSVHIGFSSTILPSVGLTGITAPQSLTAIYSKLLALQQSFIPFTVTTPKRTYSNMLFLTLGNTTDKATENILSINATFQQIITVSIIIGNVPRSQLSNPGSNGGTQPVGQKQSFISGVSDAISDLKKSTVGGAP